ncbi:hypothetical protein [Kouleothrix sp.]|uniref:hypothetical protein n=1 Tax=Kouleothrix sp. TaxID=2779161 RepID=UPI00391B2FD1
MPQVIVMVLTDATQLEPLINAWTDAGARGVTIIDSTGMARLSGGWTRDDTPLFPSLRDLLEQADPDHRTLFTVADDAQVDALVAAAQRVVGDFDAADSGLLFTVPVGRVLGLRRAQ